jgi:hypothetical protein
MAHPDLDELLDVLLPFAKKKLQEHGDFHPFGALMQSDGAMEMVGASDGNEFPKAMDLIQILEASFRKSAQLGEIKAAGICCDVRVIPPGEQDKTDAIQMTLEHLEGQTVSVFLTYRKGASKEVTYGQLFATAAEKKIFVKTQ